MGTAERAIAVLELLSAAEERPTHAEISRALAIPRSTLFELLALLRRLGYVHAAEQRYEIGPSLFALAYRVSQRVGVPVRLRAILSELANSTGETCVYSVEIGGSADTAGVVLPIHHVESEQPIRFVPWLGQPMPIEGTAAGLVLLAFSHRGASSIRAPAEHVPFDAVDLDRELEAVRERRYAIFRGGLVADAISLAAPVRGPSGAVVAAVSVTGPAERMSDAEEHVWLALHEASIRLSAGG